MQIVYSNNFILTIFSLFALCFRPVRVVCFPAAVPSCQQLSGANRLQATATEQPLNIQQQVGYKTNVGIANLDCRWLFEAPAGQCVQMSVNRVQQVENDKFTLFNANPSAPTDRDQWQVTHHTGEDRSYAQITSPQKVTSTSRYMGMEHASEPAHNRRLSTTDMTYQGTTCLCAVFGERFRGKKNCRLQIAAVACPAGRKRRQANASEGW